MSNLSYREAFQQGYKAGVESGHQNTIDVVIRYLEKVLEDLKDAKETKITFTEDK